MFIPSILFSKFVTVQRRLGISDMRCSFMQFLIAELPRSKSMYFLVPSSPLVSSSRRALSCVNLWLVIFQGCFRVISFPDPFKARLTRWTNNVGRAFTARPFAINNFRVMTFTWDRWPCFRVRTASSYKS